MLKVGLLLGGQLLSGGLASKCDSMGGQLVDIPFDVAKHLKFYGVSESDIEVTRKTGPAKIVVKDYSAAVTHELDGDTLVIHVGECDAGGDADDDHGGGAPTPAGEEDDDHGDDDHGAPTPAEEHTKVSSPAHRVRPLSAALPAVAVLALGHDVKTAAVLGGLMMAFGASAEGTCNNFVSVEIYTPAAEAEAHPECPNPDAHDDTLESKLHIFDSPNAVEMEKIFDLFTTYDFSAEGADIHFHPILRGDVKGRTPKPDATRITELFGDESLATAQKHSPAVTDHATEPSIWGGIMTTYISRFDPCPIPKADATAYLYGDGPEPKRYACVNVAFGSLAEPHFSEYSVGPLDAAEMTVTKLKQQIWGSRPREGTEMQALKTMVDIILNEEDLKTIQMESFDGKWHGHGLNNHEPAPPGLLANERHTQILINFHIEGTWRGKDENLVPLSFTIDNSHGDPSMWTADHFYYNHQGPYTRDELVAKYKDGSLTKVVLATGHYDKINGFPKVVEGTTWPTRRTDAPYRHHAEKPGPKSVLPAGARFDVKGRVVKWMDWEFHAGYTFRSGPNVMGITFKGQRIAYQVALSEVALQYSANDPVAGNVFFFDCTFGNGEFRELVRGMDCPDHATLMDNYWWAPNGGARDAKRATCVYEHWTGGPLWRRGGPFVSVQPKYELHMRQIVTNGNYDYMVTYKFGLDGSLDVDMESTGFLQTHYYPTNWPPRYSMGNRIMDYSGGSVHDHTYGFKVDLDVETEHNSFQTMEYKVSPKTEALNTDTEQNWAECDKDLGTDFACDKADAHTYTDADTPYLLFKYARHTDVETIETEMHARVNADPAHPKAWLFGDTTNLNKWGNSKKYVIKLHDITQNLLPNDHHTMKANSFSKQNLAVTVHKDEEYYITGNYDLNRLRLENGEDGSEMSIDKMTEDDENIVQKDLVAWLGLATQHYPTSENMPMTTGIRHGFSLHPWNFFDENPTMDMPNYLRVMPGETGERGCEDNCAKEDLPHAEQCTTRPEDTSHDFAGVW